METLSFGLLLAAAAMGLTHTLLGPDHYLPFILMARARNWSTRQTALVTVACGGAHVASSLLLGCAGLVTGVALGAVEQAEAGRGVLAAWALVALGGAYGVWGLRQGLRRKRGLEPHAHGDEVHLHRSGGLPHSHAGTGPLPAGRAPTGKAATFWALLLVFILGPCEPLIPLFILPASRGRWGLAAAAAAVFGVVTVATMVGATLLGRAGLSPRVLAPVALWDHALAGGIVALSGLAVLFLGL